MDETHLPLARMRHCRTARNVGLQGALVPLAEGHSRRHLGHLPSWPRNNENAKRGLHRGSQASAAMDSGAAMTPDQLPAGLRVKALEWNP